MGENYTGFIKLFKKAAASKKFQRLLNEQLTEAVQNAIAYRCPGCNIKVPISHSVDACIQTKYQTISRELDSLQQKTAEQTQLQKRADQIRAKYRQILH